MAQPCPCIPLQDLLQIWPDHGDFFRIVIPPVPDQLQQIPTRPAARCAQLGIPARRIVTYYEHHDIENDLNAMPTAHPGGFVDEIALQQISITPHLRCVPRQHRREDDPMEQRAIYIQESHGLQHDATDWAPLMTGFGGEVLLQWQSFAQLGPGQMESFVRVRTWYNDHVRWPH